MIFCKTHHTQGRNEARWSPGQETSLVPSCSNLMSFGNKCSVLKKVLVAWLGLFGTPAVIRCPGIVLLFLPRCAPDHTLILVINSSINSIFLLSTKCLT